MLKDHDQLLEEAENLHPKEIDVMEAATEMEEEMTETTETEIIETTETTEIGIETVTVGDTSPASTLTLTTKTTMEVC